MVAGSDRNGDFRDHGALLSSSASGVSGDASGIMSPPKTVFFINIYIYNMYICICTYRSVCTYTNVYMCELP